MKRELPSNLYRYTQHHGAQSKGDTLLVILFLESSEGTSESIAGTLDLIDGIGGTLGLVATLTDVATPLLKDKGQASGHGLGESISRALDVEGGIGGSLAALANVATPLGEGLAGSKSRGLDGASGDNGDDDGGELHLDGWRRNRGFEIGKLV